MLFLLFKLGEERYAIEARQVVEVAPLLELQPLPLAPRGVAGLFNYRGQPVPAIDLSLLTLGRPATARLSTRLIIVNHPGHDGGERLVGLIAEHATEILRREPADFKETGLSMAQAPYLGPVLLDSEGAVQWINTQRLLPEEVRTALFTHPQLLSYAAG